MFPKSLNLLQCDGIFFNLYTGCFLLLLASQNLAINAQIDTSDHFYVAKRISDRNYYEECYVVNKSVIINSAIFKQITGLTCTISGITMTITSSQGNSQISFTGYATDSPKPIYLMSKSFIDNIIRSSATDYFAMGEMTIGSLFAQLQLKMHGNLSLNYMYIENKDGAGFSRFFLDVRSNNYRQNFSHIIWFKPGTDVLKFYFS